MKRLYQVMDLPLAKNKHYKQQKTEEYKKSPLGQIFVPSPNNHPN